MGFAGIGATRRLVATSKAATNEGMDFVIGEARCKAFSVFKKISGDFGGSHSSAGKDFYYLSSTQDQENKGAKEFLYRVDVFAQGPITDYKYFYVDKDRHNSSRYTPRAYVQIFGYHGAAGQTAFAWDSGIGSGRSTNHKGVDVAYAINRFYAHGSKPAFNGEPEVDAVLEGYPLYDPRLDNNEGGSGTHTKGDISTYEYAANPPLGLLTYLTESVGADWLFNDLDIASFADAADFCDELKTSPGLQTNDTGSAVDIYTYLGSLFTVGIGVSWPEQPDRATAGQQKRMIASLKLSPSSTVKENIEQSLRVMHGHLPFSNGKYKLIIEDEVLATVMSFDDDSILGNWKFSEVGRKDRLNRATVTFINQFKNHKEDSVSWPEIGSTEHTAYLAADNAQPLQQTFEVTGVPDYHQASAWAEFKVRNSRSNRRVTVDLAPKAMLLEYGDVINITSVVRGWTDKWFRVKKVTLKPGGTNTVEMVEYDGTIYPWSTKADEPLDALPSDPSVWIEAEAIIGLAAIPTHETKADGTVISGFALSWTAPSDTIPINNIEVAWRVSLTAEYSNILTVLPGSLTADIWGLIDNEDYDIRVRYYTSLGQVSADAELLFETLADAGSRISDIEDGATVNRPMFGLEDGADEVGANVQALRIIGFDAVLTPVSISLITNIPYDGGFINPTAGYKSVALISTDAPDGTYYVGYDATKTQKFVMTGTTNRDLGIVRKNGTDWEYLDYVTAGSYAWVGGAFVSAVIVIGEAVIAGSAFVGANAYAQGVDLASAPALGADVTGVNTSQDTTNVNGVTSSTVESNAQTGWDLTQFNGVVIDGSSFGLLSLTDLDPTRQIKIDGVQALATVGADWAINTASRPAELTDGRVAAGIDASGDLNRNLLAARLNSSNVLRFATGGLYSGHLIATQGGTWGVDITSRPAELTDGRLATAISAAGNLKTEVLSTALIASVSASTVKNNAQTGYDLTVNGATVLHSSSFGAMDLSDLDGTRQIKLDGVQALATVGANWATNTTSRPAELTDGRISTAIAASGYLDAGVLVDQGDGYGRAPLFGSIFGSLRDAEVITYGTAFALVPVIQFLPSGLTSEASLTGEQVIAYDAVDSTVSGFTAAILLKELVGTPASHTDTGAVAGATYDFELEKVTTTPANAWDDKYTFQFDATVYKLAEEQVGNMTVGFYVKTTSGGAWVQYATKVLSTGFNQASKVFSNQTQEVTVSGVTDFAGVQFAIHLESADSGSSTIDALDSVKYETATAPSEADAAPTGASAVPYRVYQ